MIALCLVCFFVSSIRVKLLTPRGSTTFTHIGRSPDSALLVKHFDIFMLWDLLRVMSLTYLQVLVSSILLLGIVCISSTKILPIWSMPQCMVFFQIFQDSLYSLPMRGTWITCVYTQFSDQKGYVWPCVSHCIRQ